MSCTMVSSTSRRWTNPAGRRNLSLPPHGVAARQHPSQMTATVRWRAAALPLVGDIRTLSPPKPIHPLARFAGGRSKQRGRSGACTYAKAVRRGRIEEGVDFLQHFLEQLACSFIFRLTLEHTHCELRRVPIVVPRLLGLAAQLQ